MQNLLSDPVIVWLAAGAFLIGLEAIIAPGIGIFLAGLGAICTALIIKSTLVGRDSTLPQFAWCFGFTSVWTMLLWRSLQEFRRSRKNTKSPAASDVVGETAIVAHGGITPNGGQVHWSGTLMSAQLAPGANMQSLPEGAQVKVASVSGTTLFVTPK